MTSTLLRIANALAVLGLNHRADETVRNAYCAFLSRTLECEDDPAYVQQLRAIALREWLPTAYEAMFRYKSEGGPNAKERMAMVEAIRENPCAETVDALWRAETAIRPEFVGGPTGIVYGSSAIRYAHEIMLNDSTVLTIMLIAHASVMATEATGSDGWAYSTTTIINRVAGMLKPALRAATAS